MNFVVSADKESEVRALLDREYAKSRVLKDARANYFGGGVQSVAGYAAAMQAVTETQLKSVIERHIDPKGLRLGIARKQVSR